MPGWQSISELIDVEFVQNREEGRDPRALDELEKRWRSSANSPQELEELHGDLLAVPMDVSFPFVEPSELEAIRSCRAPRPAAVPKAETAQLDRRMQGTWLGRCIGCALGKPVEAFMESMGDISSRQRQRRYLQALGAEEWPLRDYIPEHSPAEEETGAVICPPSTREHIAYMETDDDIRYTVLGQVILTERGRHFTSHDVAEAWMRHLGYARVCTAEMQAYRNLVLIREFQNDGVALGVSEGGEGELPLTWEWVATHLNPYREWIGAQIRVDSYGYAAPGLPRLAAEMAYQDARISHTKNGIYGAMCFAAMIAAAFTAPDVNAIIQAGLAEIPARSRLHSAIREVVGLCQGRRFEDFEEVFDHIEARYGHYHPVHTINNAAVCVAALCLSDGSPDKGIPLAVMGGWDTDCNGATVGSILGAFAGPEGVSPHWKDPLRDELRSGIVDYHPIAISECARRSLSIAKEVLAES